MQQFAYVSLLIWSYYVVYYSYIGFAHPVPSRGDSWDYHIPIAISILNGLFLHPPHNWPLGQWYYPGASEAINALFIPLHIPLTLTNLFASVILYVACFRLGVRFRLPYYTAVLFATSIASLNVIVRWSNAVSIDVWLAVWFLLSLLLLEQPHKTVRYFVALGAATGMFLGSKYTALAFLPVLALVYGRTIIRYLSIARLTAFLVPFSIFGVFWYIRNYLVMRNPVYGILGCQAKTVCLPPDTVWRETLAHPVEMFNAAYGEYNLWLLAIVAGLGCYVYMAFTARQPKIHGLNRLYIIGLSNVALYLTFPTDYHTWIMVSSLRYSLPALVPLILAVFVLASRYNKDRIIGFIAIGNMLMVVSMSFYPKLTVIYLLLAGILIIAIEKYKQMVAHKKSTP